MIRIYTWMLIFLFPVLVFSSSIELSGNVGIAKLDLGNAFLTVTETETDTLRQTHNPWTGEFDAGIAYVIALNKNQSSSGLIWFPELRPVLNFRYLSHRIFDESVSGQIEQYQDPTMSNYTYFLTVDSKRLMIDLALTLARLNRTSVFLKAGLGESWTQLSYRDEPNPDILDGNLILKNNTKTGFAGEVGAGLFYSFTDDLKGSIEYLYTHFGSVYTANQGLLNGTPALVGSARFSLHSNALLFGLHLTV